MNKVYRVVWNAATGTWAAVQETAKACKKSSRSATVGQATEGASTKVAGKLFALTMLGSAMLLSSQAFANTPPLTRTDANTPVATGDKCGYDTESASVICGDATTTLAKTYSGVSGDGSTHIHKTAKSVVLGIGAKSVEMDAAVGKDADLVAINAGHGESMVIIGANAQGSQQSSVAVGESAKALNGQTVAIGSNANAVGLSDIMVGKGAGSGNTVTTAPDRNIGIGEGAVSNVIYANNVIGIGTGAASGSNLSNSIAIGVDANRDVSRTPTSKDIADAANLRAQGKDAEADKLLTTNVIWTTAVGERTIASGPGATAVGAGSSAFTTSSIAMGQGAKAGAKAADGNVQSGDQANFVADYDADNAIALGTFSAAGRNAVAVGRQSRAVLSGTTAVGSNSKAVGLTSTAVGFNSIAASRNSVAMGWNSVAGVADSVDANGSKISAKTYAVAIGPAAKALETTSTALGNATLADKLNSVALGSASKTDADATKEDTATVGNLTYSGFAGDEAVAAGDQVSVGAKGEERQIKNVAPGQISNTSTDAINGSQLYATNDVLGNVAKTVVENFGGNAALNPDGSITYTNIGNTGKDNIHDAIQAATTKVEGDKGVSVTPTTNNDGSTTYNVEAKVDGTTVTINDKNEIAAKTTTFTETTDGTVGAPVDGDSLVTANTVAEAINNSGWKLAAEGVDGEELINPGDTATFETGSDNLTVTRDGANIAYDLAKDININSVQFNDGPKITNEGDNIKVSNSTGGPTKITNVANGEGDNDAVNVSQLKASQTKVEGDKGVNITSETDVNTGATTYNVEAKVDGSTITINEKGQLEANNHYYSVNDNGVKHANYNNDGATAVNALAAGTRATATETAATAVGNSATASGKNSVALGSQATANTAWSVAIGNKADATGSSAVAIGNGATTTVGDSVALGAGSKADANGRAVTEATVNGLTFGDFAGSVTHPGKVVSVGAEGEERQIKNVAPGQISNTSTDAINGSQLYATNAKLGNVANTVVENFGGNAALNPDGSITYTNIGNTGKDNIHDAIQAATTKVKGDKGVNITSETDVNTGATTYNVEAKVDGTTVTINDKNEIAAVTTTFTPSTDGSVGAPVGNGDSLVTANTVADAINNSGWKATSGATGSGVVDGTTEELINPSETVTFQAGDNMVLNQAGNVFTYSLNKDININSVQFNDGPKITNDGDNIKVGDKDGNATKITNVKAGEADTDAVNVSQLEKAQAAATTKVEEADGIKVVPTTNADGSTTYTVSAKTDGTTTKIDGNGNIAAVTTTFTPSTDGKVGAPVGNGDSLVTAKTVADAINSSGFTLKTSATADGKKLAGGDELINPGDSVEMIAGKNMQVTQEINGKVTYATKDEVEFNKVTVGPVSINNVTGIDAGNTAITNVKAGVADTDAVNVSQLKAAQAAATTKVEGDKGVSVTPKTNNDGSTTYTVAAKTDNTTVKVDDNGNIAAVTTTFTPSTDGKVGAPVGNGDSLVTAKTVADAINSSGFTLKTSATANGKKLAGGDELINPGDSVEMIAGKNMQVTQEINGKVTYATKDEVEFNKVTVGPVSINNVTGIDAGNTAITNVKAGVADTDAVNVSQLKAAQAAAATKVEGDKGVSVTPKTNADGSKTYTVAAKTDNTTVKVDGNGNIAAVTTTFTPSTDGKVGAPVGNGDSLVTAKTVADAINNSGWKLAADGTDGTELINPSDTVTFKTGSDNLTVTRTGADITYDLARNINVDSVQIGANGPKITKDDNGNIQVGDKDGNAVKITNVAAGTAPTDAVNVSQLEDRVGGIENRVNNRIDDVADDANAGVSSAMAMAALPQAYIPGKSMLTGGIASYNGEGAVAVGFSKLSDNGRWVLKVSGSADTEGNAGGAVGAGFHF